MKQINELINFYVVKDILSYNQLEGTILLIFIAVTTINDIINKHRMNKSQNSRISILCLIKQR